MKLLYCYKCNTLALSVIKMESISETAAAVFSCGVYKNQ